MNRSRITGDLVSQNNIFVDIANDRVGIGSTIPGTKLQLPDSEVLSLGNAGDLQLVHTPSLSQISSGGINNFTIRQSAGNGFLFIHGDQLHLRSQSTNEPYFTATNNGPVTLFYDNSERFKTETYGINVTGTTDTDGLVVSGVTTTTGSVNVGDDLDVTDDLTIGGEFGMIGSSDSNKYFDARIGSSNTLVFRSASGGGGNLVTMLQLGVGGSSLVGNLTLADSTDSSSAAGPEFTLNRNSSSPANADYLGQIKFAGRSSTGVQRNYAKITGKILDVTNGAEDGILEFAHIKNGSQVITGRWRSDSLQLLNSTNFSVAGTLEVTGTSSLQSTVSIDTTLNEKLVLRGSSDPYVRFKQGTTDKAYIQWDSGNAAFVFVNQASSEQLKIESGLNGLVFRAGDSNYTVWHAGNDGSGSGLDADTVDGLHASSFLRSDATDSFNCNGNALGFNFDNTGRNSIVFNLSGSTYWQFLHDNSGQDLNIDRVAGSGVLKVNGSRILSTADEGTGNGLDADTVDGIHASSFLRSDAVDVFNCNGNALQFDFDTNNRNSIAFTLNGSVYWQFLHDNSGQDLNIDRNAGSGIVKIDGNKIFHAGNDGSGSGLDADTLDGVQGSSFLRSDADDTTSGHLTLSDSGYSIGNEFHVWKRNYVVNNSNPQELLYEDGNSLPAGGSYRFTAHISATGTDNFATAVYWNQNGTWKLNVTYQSGTSSNHPEFILNGGVPTIATDHSSNYTIHVLGERIELNEGTGSDNRNGFGADGYFSSSPTDLRYNRDGSGAIGSGNLVWHEGNDGSGSGLDADKLDGVQGSSYLRSDAADTFTNALTFSQDNSDVVDFSANSSNNNRGISFNNRTALSAAGTSNGWLRLNNASEFTNGVYTPGLIRADGGFLSNGTVKVGDGTNGLSISFGGVFASTSVGHNASNDEGIFWHVDNRYGIYRTAGAWTNPNYQQLKLNWITGIILDGGKDYGKSGVEVIGDIEGAFRVNTANDGKIELLGSSNPFIRFKEGTTEKAYIQWNASGFLQLTNQESNESIRIKSGSNGLKFLIDGAENNIWHAGNDGSGSGLDADTVDGIHASSFCRTDTTFTFNGSGNDINIDYDNNRNLVRIQRSGSERFMLGASGNEIKINTSNGGFLTFGTSLLPQNDNSVDLGSSSKRWANLYTADAHFSNVGTGGNDIDGTEGSWTLQEAEDTIYMINRKNGKRYKIKMEEV